MNLSFIKIYPLIKIPFFLAILICTLGISQSAFSGEPAWWTQQKKDNCLPASMAYETWKAQGYPNNCSGGAGSGTAPSASDTAAMNAAANIGYSIGTSLNKILFGDPEAAKRKKIQDEIDARNAENLRIQKQNEEIARMKKHKELVDDVKKHLKGSSPEIGGLKDIGASGGSFALKEIGKAESKPKKQKTPTHMIEVPADWQ